jgi:transposase
MTNHIFLLSRQEKEKRRLKAGKLFEKGITQAKIAQKMKVSHTAALLWYQAWEKEGLGGLKSKGKSGPEPQLAEEDRKKVRAAIIKGASKFGYDSDLWTLDRVAAVIKKLTKIKFKRTHTWEILISIGLTCQKPQLKPKEQNQKEIKKWKLKTFPKLKKMGRKTWIFTGIPR